MSFEGKRCYFDIAATTPLDNDVVNKMSDTMQRIFGNPSSIHSFGQESKIVLEKARKQIATAIHCRTSEVCFTSCGSESNNMVLKGILKKGDHFITGSIEHPSILKTADFLQNKGVEITLIQPDKFGTISISKIEESIKDNTKLISIMSANNELGTINPIKEIGDLAKQNSILFHTDAVQSFGKVPFNASELLCDFISIGAHKIYGPRGAGALIIKAGNNLFPLIHGGGQESNLRAGTENIIDTAGFGKASEIAVNNLEKNIQTIKYLSAHFLKGLDENKIEYRINGTNQLPGIFNITFFGVNANDLVINLDMEGIAISAGSACSAGVVKPSSTLTEIGMTPELALSTVRISFGKLNTTEEIDYFIPKLSDIILRLKSS
ncbi:MAG: cysteine desulfurase [Candidatus Marinimicrobia bacterium]|nr:cysteine desulfurase [Candidatus Neomarinimicrobiota bacterium]MBL7022857.1 cysteine desulfurase [Candidatus Neomarinimicrobiota bacterium]MBL7110043.1 cysteine desulfurase [Candidatus Neomarinimicrobiota bacterium]